MIDWEGLLKFSLQHSDGTKKSDFKEMSQEDKKWLQQAMKHYCNSEIQRIKTILDQLSKQQQDRQQQRLSLLQQLQQILDSLDKGTTLYKMGGHIILLRIIFFSKFESNKIVAIQIFSSINQNDSFIQTESINCGALELVEVIVKQESIKLRQNLMSAISSILRGENLEAKRIFIKIKGLKVLEFLLNDEKTNSKRLQHKIFMLLRDFLYYDDRLHYTYNDLSSFSNTANIEIDKDKKSQSNTLTYDKNKQIVNNQLEQNKKFKGYFSHWLSEHTYIQKMYSSWLKQQQELEKS